MMEEGRCRDDNLDENGNCRMDKDICLRGNCEGYIESKKAKKEKEDEQNK